MQSQAPSVVREPAPSFEARRRRRFRIFRPHPEELAKQASRRMDATPEPAAILRYTRQGALLRMRSEIHSRPLRMRSNLLKHNNLMLRSERRECLEAWAASDSPISHRQP